MRMECKHGRPVFWDIGQAEWRDDQSLRQTVTVTMCQACVDDGSAAALMGVIERGITQRHVEQTGDES
jgi:hypothetical protein